jgi:hypothetical protein
MTDGACPKGGRGGHGDGGEGLVGGPQSQEGVLRCVGAGHGRWPEFLLSAQHALSVAGAGGRHYAVLPSLVHKTRVCGGALARMPLVLPVKAMCHGSCSAVGKVIARGAAPGTSLTMGGQGVLGCRKATARGAVPFNSLTTGAQSCAGLAAQPPCDKGTPGPLHIPPAARTPTTKNDARRPLMQQQDPAGRRLSKEWGSAV